MPWPDLDYPRLMKRALRLAMKGEGFVHPNPLVGALLVKDGAVIGEGWHRAVGGPHAEVNAVADARKRGHDPRGALLVVTLEPCAHFGRTPPCVEMLVETGISNAVVGMIDPNPLVSGRGVGFLRESGIEVRERVLDNECLAINRAFVKYITHRRPYVLLKAAMTLDGRIATRAGHSKWISGEASLRFAHKLRHAYQAILVGAGTVRADDPQLTCRLAGRKRVHHPTRIILDGRLSIPMTSRLVMGGLPGETIIATTDVADPAKIAALERAGLAVIRMSGSDGRVDLSDLMDELGRRKIASLLVEGGSEVLAQFLECRLADRLNFVIAPKIFGGRDALPVIGGRGVESAGEAVRLADMRVTRLGEDLLVEGDPVFEEKAPLQRNEK